MRIIIYSFFMIVACVAGLISIALAFTTDTPAIGLTIGVILWALVPLGLFHYKREILRAIVTESVEIVEGETNDKK